MAKSDHNPKPLMQNHVQERFDIEVVRGKDDLKEHLLVNSDEFLVPFADVSSTLSRLFLA